MKYLLLMYGDESVWDEGTAEEQPGPVEGGGDQSHEDGDDHRRPSQSFVGTELTNSAREAHRSPPRSKDIVGVPRISRDMDLYSPSAQRPSWSS